MLEAAAVETRRFRGYTLVMDKTIAVVPRRFPTSADAAYWLSRPAADRLSAVEFLREQSYLVAGLSEMPRLERTVRVLPARP